jgi:hypothetical protein
LRDDTLDCFDGCCVEEVRGGGFLSRNALPNFKYNAIIQNIGVVRPIKKGGGGDETTGINVPTHPDYDWGNPRSECTGELDLSYNFYSNNDATYGNTFSTLNFTGSVNMTNSIFDVYNCLEEEVSTVWVDVDEEVEDVSFDDGVGDDCAIVSGNVWISPDGDDEINAGTTPEDAFLTIHRALEMIFPSVRFKLMGLSPDGKIISSARCIVKKASSGVVPAFTSSSPSGDIQTLPATIAQSSPTPSSKLTSSVSSSTTTQTVLTSSSRQLYTSKMLFVIFTDPVKFKVEKVFP